jgi:hypothetical protein
VSDPEAVHAIVPAFLQSSCAAQDTVSICMGVDASLTDLPTDRRALPKWRYELRQRTLPLVRWETPYLAWLQANLRTPALDSYFAITANLGTHTFFMIGLPILFWCGYESFGKG